MDLRLNAERFSGDEYVELYNQYRPIPPIEIINQSLNYLNREKAGRILDLGSGTGISTRIWSDYGKEIIGIEPSEEMLHRAKKETKQENVNYRLGFGNEIKLLSESIDIITCSQSFHWMEPQSTLKEINRLLKKGGVLVVYDVIWPPTVNYEYEKAYNELFERVDEKTLELKEVISHKWNKKDHKKNIIESGFFRYTKETYYHKRKKLDKDEFIGIAISQGGLQALMKRGYTKEEIGIEKFKKELDSLQQPIMNEMTYNYRVIFGIK
jgi:ubiquinone/menaquinone biosynthesis C-methylase UbiE